MSGPDMSYTGADETWSNVVQVKEAAWRGPTPPAPRGADGQPAPRRTWGQTAARLGWEHAGSLPSPGPAQPSLGRERRPQAQTG